MINKKFNKSYDDALTQSYLFHNEFVNDNAEFTAFSPIFADPFAADFLSLIEIADNFPTNEEDLNNQVILSTQVEETMDTARALYQKLLFYLGIAFPNSETTLLAFGNNLYEKARQIPSKMVNLLQNAYLNANSTTYKASLIAAGFVQTDIDSLHSLEDELTEIYNSQQDYIQHSYKRTEDRTVAFNNVWDVMVKISNASKLIFKDSPAKIEFYLLYPETGTIGTLTAPTNFAWHNDNNTLSWDEVANATSYQVEMSQDNVSWTEIYADVYSVFNYVPPSSGTFFFRCRARNAGGYGDFCHPIEIQYFTTLPVPQNLQAIASGPTGTDIEITWDPVPTANWYTLYRSMVNIGAPVGSWSNQGNQYTTSLVQSVAAGHRYYFKIYAANPMQHSDDTVPVFVDIP